jgi:hypothetical protein
MSDLQEPGHEAGGVASGGEWLTVAEAAGRLQVSERTVKRRIKAREWPSRYEPLPGGGRRRLLHFLPGGTTVEDTRVIGTGDTRDNEKDTLPSVESSSIGTGDNVEDTSAKDTEDTRANGESDTQASRVATLESERDAAREEVESLKAERDREREEVLFLRERVMELNAIVMQTARALPSQATERPAIEASGATTPSAPHKPAPGPRPAPPQPRRKPRPLWAVIFGIRPK